MAGAGNRVDLDTRELDRGVEQLIRGIVRLSPPAADQTARTVAARLVELVPVDTGALRETVQVEQFTEAGAEGSEVHYGGDLPYAGVIVIRTGCTHKALEGTPRAFYNLEREVAAREVRKL